MNQLYHLSAESFHLDKIRFINYPLRSAECNLYGTRVIINKDKLCASCSVNILHCILIDDLLSDEILNVLWRELLLCLHPLVILGKSYD